MLEVNMMSPGRVTKYDSQKDGTQAIFSQQKLDSGHYNNHTGFHGEHTIKNLKGSIGSSRNESELYAIKQQNLSERQNFTKS